MTEQQHHFQRGDVVKHLRRPEWGRGEVKESRAITHEGRAAQRLTVHFANKGRVVINTAVAPLEKHRSDESMSRNSTSTATADSGGWLAQLERANGQRKHELWDLPAAMTDPFASPAQRLHATLDSYRFSTEPRSLIEWATMQTGLDDPLSKYTRSELEQAFPRFVRDRNQHLFDLARQIKRKGDTHTLQQAMAQTRVPAAKQALQKAAR